MIHSKRKPLNKYKSTGKFRRDVGKVHPKNMRPPPMRGGYRL